ncbi:uncharacterized protein K489DRAFT_189752 [Dissoconium aciculare CBS 342.82]|uniref:Uncharacterized protein n=1 Tax=Dissoconium aciculare CBS 342.82 TaxID=1314786 RepID=A0A6J3MA91_9PEZI|nr:uncharacterized protein K489DRAFT_189752 [Dissoconium aciculare CBS 342.82]KAF1824768.1 hypothetical protein K489DRAFT_189752 [Dissoconium aciculare CBS 342.82]
MPFYVTGTDNVQFYSEQLDVRVTRIQNRVQSAVEMRMIYPKSWLHGWDEKDDGMEFGGELDDAMTMSEFFELMSTPKMDEVEMKLNVRGILIEHVIDRIRLFDHRPDLPPDLRYVIYVPFAHSDEQILGSAARTFTASILDRIQVGTTIDFHFHRPSIPTDSSALSHFASLNLPPNFVGTFTRLQADRKFDDPFDYIRPPEPHPRRLHPLSLEPNIVWNDPATFRCEPYKTFVVVLDRPDFHTSASVRFLLADGGPWRGDKVIAAQDYSEMEVWRAPDIEAVVRRLTFTQLY